MTMNTWRYADTYEYLDRVRSGLGPVIITCAVNGGEQGRESHPTLPESPEQIAEACLGAYQAGAAAVHIHPRSRQNIANTSMVAEEFLQVNQLVRAECPDLIINNTTGASIDPDGIVREDILDARPEMASLNLGPDMSILRYRERPAPHQHPRSAHEVDDVAPWTYGKIESLAVAMRNRGVKPEMEVYHPGQFWVSRRLIELGLVEPPYVHQFVMGYQTSSFATPQHVLDLVRDLPDNSSFAVAGVGMHQLPMVTMSLLLGGHVRVGLEDNLYALRGILLADNADAVRRTARLAEDLRRPVASPAEARAILGLSQPRPYPQPVGP